MYVVFSTEIRRKQQQLSGLERKKNTVLQVKIKMEPETRMHLKHALQRVGKIQTWPECERSGIGVSH